MIHLFDALSSRRCHCLVLEMAGAEHFTIFYFVIYYSISDVDRIGHLGEFSAEFFAKYS